MLLANGKTLQELDNKEISVLDCTAAKAVLVIGSSAERYAMINMILDSINDPRYILRSVEHDGIWYPNYEKDEDRKKSVVIEV